MALTIDFQGKIVLITGATSGIGLGIAKVMAESGCTVIGCAEVGHDSEEARDFLALNDKYTGEIIYKKADVSLSRDIDHLVNDIGEEFGRLDILISNAGKNVFAGLDGCSDEEWQFNLNLNLTAHWRVAKGFRSLLRIKNGVIIIMASNHAYSSISGCSPYNIAKTALTGMVRSLAIEWGPEIRTVGIAPGFIDTPGNQNWFDQFPDPVKERERTVNAHPVKKIGTAEEIGGWCVFLASGYANFASGTTYLVDGGRSALMQDEG